MFKRAVILTSLSMALLTLGWLFNLVYMTSADKAKYEEVIKAGQAIAKATKDQRTSQNRSGVRKDLWLSQQDRTRLHYRIDSKSSVLTLLPIDDKMDIIENLHHIQCWMQDKLYASGYDKGNAPMQQMRFFEADQGTYQYSTQKFNASSVALSIFRIPGTQLPATIDQKTDFLRGIAQDVSFSVAGKTTQFQAQRFKATLLSQQEENL